MRYQTHKRSHTRGGSLRWQVDPVRDKPIRRQDGDGKAIPNTFITFTHQVNICTWYVLVHTYLVPDTGTRNARSLSPREQRSTCLLPSRVSNRTRCFSLCKLSVLPTSSGGVCQPSRTATAQPAGHNHQQPVDRANESHAWRVKSEVIILFQRRLLGIADLFIYELRGAKAR